MSSRSTESNDFDHILDFVKESPLFVFEQEKKPLRDLYRAIKHLPQNQDRISFLKHIKEENFTLNLIIDKDEYNLKEREILLKILFDSYEKDDLEVFRETLTSDKAVKSIAFMKKKIDPYKNQCMFEILWRCKKYDEFFSTLMDSVGSFQSDLNELLNEKFKENNAEEICILLHDKNMQDFQKINNKNGIKDILIDLYEQLYDKIINSNATVFETMSKVFFNEVSAEIYNEIRAYCNKSKTITSALNNDAIYHFNDDYFKIQMIASFERFIHYIFKIESHKVNYDVITNPESVIYENLEDLMSFKINLEEFNNEKMQFLLQNNIIWNECEAFKINFKLYNKKFLNSSFNVNLNASFIFNLLKISILKNNLTIFCEILDNILVEENKYIGWTYIDEICDMNTTLISYAIKWNNSDSLNELLKRKSRLLLKDDFYYCNLEFFEVNNDLIKNHLDKCLTSFKNTKDNTIICFDFSNFVPNVDFYDDLEFSEIDCSGNFYEINEAMNRNSSINRWKLAQNVLFVTKKISKNEIVAFQNNKKQLATGMEYNSDNNDELVEAKVTYNAEKESLKNTEIINLTSDKSLSKSNATEYKFSNIIYDFAVREHLQHLLMHPIISTQIFLKWHEFSIINTINFFITLITFIFLIVYCYTKFIPNVNMKFLDLISSIILTYVSIPHKFLRTLLHFQFKTTLKKNLNIFKKPKEQITDNIFNMFNIILLIIIIATTIFTLSTEIIKADNTNKETFSNGINNTNINYNIYGIPFMCVLFTVLDLTIVIKSLTFGNSSDYVFMLEQVTLTYINILLIFSIYVVAFTICFMMLFKENFKKVISSTILILTMAVGEFNTDSMNFDEMSGWHIILFFLFVFFMALVIINLLNGLAVSDVQEIKTKAELGSLQYKVNQLYHFEENIKYFSKWKILQKLIEIFRIRYFSSKIYLHANTGYLSHFPITARSVKNTVYLKEQNYLFFKKNLKLDIRIIESTKLIIKE